MYKLDQGRRNWAVPNRRDLPSPCQARVPRRRSQRLLFAKRPADFQVLRVIRHLGRYGTSYRRWLWIDSWIVQGRAFFLYCTWSGSGQLGVVNAEMLPSNLSLLCAGLFLTNRSATRSQRCQEKKGFSGFEGKLTEEKDQWMPLKDNNVHGTACYPLRFFDPSDSVLCPT